MTTLFLLVLAIGIAPLVAGLVLLKPTAESLRLSAGSVLLCALAFNLTFFWQELWLVVPKALTPGLHPILYHNDHDWTGQAPIAELLQGTGAIATLISGLVFATALALAKRAPATWRLFLFWMAFQGLFQSMAQLAVGTLLPGNDVGRALAYLHFGGAAKIALLAAAVAAMASAGAWLARAYPAGGATRAVGYGIVLTALIAVALIIPFRLPRHIIEVALIPLIVNLVGAGWLVLGLALARTGGRRLEAQPPSVVGPALALAATLLVFQLILRPGISF